MVDFIALIIPVLLGFFGAVLVGLLMFVLLCIGGYSAFHGIQFSNKRNKRNKNKSGKE